MQLVRTLQRSMRMFLCTSCGIQFGMLLHASCDVYAPA